MKHFIALLTLFLSYSAFACEVQMPEQMVILYTEKFSAKNLSATSCAPAALEEVAAVIGELEGNIASFQLSEMLANKGHKVSFNPTRIQIKQLKNIIHDQLNLPQNHRLKTIQKFSQEDFFSLSSGQKIEISCAHCPSGPNEQQQYNMKVSQPDGSIKNHFILADYKKYVKAYSLKAPLSPFSEIKDLSIFEVEFVEEIPHTELISDLNTLRFFRTNKALKKGDLLKKADLNTVDLVRAGFKTEVLLENDVLKIKTHGISNSSGGIGSWVEVYNTEKNKKYFGKVIDNNKVLVEL